MFCNFLVFVSVRICKWRQLILVDFLSDTYVLQNTDTSDVCDMCRYIYLMFH